MIDSSFIRNVIFPIATLLIICGLLLDQIRLMARVRAIEMKVFNRSPLEQMAIEEGLESSLCAAEGSGEKN